MAAQDIYISPRQILSYLRTFEEKIPIAQKDYYKPSLSITPISEDALNSEAKKMMSFVGLSEYTPKCTCTHVKAQIYTCIDICTHWPKMPTHGHAYPKKTHACELTKHT